MAAVLAGHLAATAALTCLLLAILFLQQLAWGLRRMSRWTVARWDGRERRAATASGAPWRGRERRRAVPA